MSLKPNNIVHPIIEEENDDKELNKLDRQESTQTVPDLSDEENETPSQVSVIDIFGAGERTAPEGEVSKTESSEQQQQPLPLTNGTAGNHRVEEEIMIPLDLPGRILSEEDLTDRRDSSASSTVTLKSKVQGNIDALKNVGHLLIKQINKDKEDFANVPNNYEIVAKGIGRIFIGKEETHPEVRAKTKSSTNISQPFRMSVFDIFTGHEVLRIDRNGVNDEPTSVMQIKGKSIDEQLGIIHFEHNCLMMIPSYYIQDHTGTTIIKITGPPSGRLCHSIKYLTSTFDIYDSTGLQRIAKITKDGDFYVNLKEKPEAVTKEENLYIDFEDSTLDIKTKALILGTTFMLDYTYYKEPSFFTKLASFCCVVLPCCKTSK